MPLICSSSSKTLAYISGHAHGYERFKVKECEGVMFIVSAGGGGPRPDKLGKVYKDEFGMKRGKRPLHWLKVETGNEKGIGIEVVGLNDEIIESYEMQYR